MLWGIYNLGLRAAYSCRTIENDMLYRQVLLIVRKTEREEENVQEINATGGWVCTPVSGC